MNVENQSENTQNTKTQKSGENTKTKSPNDKTRKNNNDKKRGRKRKREPTNPNEVNFVNFNDVRVQFKPYYRRVVQKQQLEEDAIKFRNESEVLLTQTPGVLEIDDPLKSTMSITQNIIKDSVEISAAEKIFNLTLKTGPYVAKYSKNGRYVILGGYRGHVAVFDWMKSNLITELNVNESVKDVAFLHNETMFAVAQKNVLNIYDKKGILIHEMEKIPSPKFIDYLPYHYLLASATNEGNLSYLDISIGKTISNLKTQYGVPSAMAQNKRNAVIHIGHQNGIVTLWCPKIPHAAVKMLCHGGLPIKAIAIDPTNNIMATTAINKEIKIWDLRNYQPINQLYMKKSEITSLDFSQQGLLAASYGPHITVWKDPKNSLKDRYMRHRIPNGDVNSLRFCPYEDVLGIGSSEGFSSILIPGSGEPNFDTFEANPFQNKRQRAESTIAGLLEKIPPELISVETDDINKVISQKKEKPKTFMELQAELKKVRNQKALVHGSGSHDKKLLLEAQEKQLIHSIEDIKNEHASKKFENKTALDRFKKKSPGQPKKKNTQT